MHLIYSFYEARYLLVLRLTLTYPYLLSIKAGLQTPNQKQQQLSIST